MKPKRRNPAALVDPKLSVVIPVFNEKATLDEILRRVPDKPAGAVGFCFGGGLIWQLLASGEPRLTAAVPFYGPLPDNPDFSQSKAAVLAFYGELDKRVTSSKDQAAAAYRGGRR